MNAATLARARETAEAAMTDECRINRPGTVTFNRATEQQETIPGDLVYEGKCSVQAGGRGRGYRDTEEGGADTAVLEPVLRLPHTAAGIQKDDEVTITAAENPDLLAAEDLVVARPDLRTRRASTIIPTTHRHVGAG